MMVNKSVAGDDGTQDMTEMMRGLRTFDYETSVMYTPREKIASSQMCSMTQTAF